MSYEIISYFDNIDFAELALDRLRNTNLALQHIEVLENRHMAERRADPTLITMPYLTPGQQTEFYAVSATNISGYGSAENGFWYSTYNGPQYRNAQYEPAEREDVMLSVTVEEEDVSSVCHILRNIGGHNVMPVKR